MYSKPAAAALVVDDNFFNRDLCKLALKHVGFEVTEAQDGKEALDVLEKQSFDLLILDLAMPELDGAGVLRNLRAQPKHRRMSVIVMTANPHMLIDDVFNAVDFVMNKPIDVEAFAKLAERLGKDKVS